MGQLLTAECSNCGFRQKNISFGGVKSNFKTVQQVPAINNETGKMEVVNFYDKTLYSKYRFYNDPTLQGPQASKYPEIMSFDFVMSAGDNYCPDCKEYTMKFITVAYTD